MKTRILTIIAAGLPCLIQAQSLSFQGSTLESGTALQEGAVYRFTNVIDNQVDALVAINQIGANSTLSSIDSSDLGTDGLNILNNAAFRPVINTISPDGTTVTSSILFGISFVATGTDNAVTLDNFSAEVFDTDGDNDRSDRRDRQDGDLREFVFSNGTVDFRGENLTAVTSTIDPVGALGSEATTAVTNPGVNDTAAFRTDFSYSDTSEIIFRLGATGNDNLNNSDNDRLYGIFFTGDVPTVTPVPEPSSTALLGLGTIGLLVRRKR